jgi:transcriptional regulator with GAF, ATPase, and Fis domain
VRPTETADETDDPTHLPGEGVPGIIVAFSGGEASRRVLVLEKGGLVVGRESGPGKLLLDDRRLSRRHARIVRDARGWHIHDEGSRNGTYVNGAPVAGSVTLASPRVIRVGNTLLVPTDDVQAAIKVPPSSADRVVGQRLAAVLADVALAARSSRTLLIEGESGTGKDLVARAFHAQGPARSGPYVPINAAAIPSELAERLLFGAKKGSYSGATADAGGHLDAAHRGVLFLDEAGELALPVQAKLLRAIETREILPLGASLGHEVDVRICAATNRDLRTTVADGHFRADLYHRLATPSVRLPPLRERVDEIPWHIHFELASVASEMTAHVKLVESCMLRPWTGNVRELRRNVLLAAQRAHAASSSMVTLDQLSESAGASFIPSASTIPPVSEAMVPEAPAAPPAAAEPAFRQYAPRRDARTTSAEVRNALERANGNVTEAARTLGLHRTQFYREMQRWSIGIPK